MTNIVLDNNIVNVVNLRLSDIVVKNIKPTTVVLPLVGPAGTGGGANVLSVFGRIGAVLAQAADYAAYYDSLGAAGAAVAAEVTARNTAITNAIAALGLGNIVTHAASDFVTPAQQTAALAALVNAAPILLDTLSEIDAAINNDPNFATTISTQMATKANDTAVVHNTGTESIAGVKTFSSSPVVPDGSFAEAKVIGLVADLAALSGAITAAITTAHNDATSQITALGLGTASTKDTGTSSGQVGLLGAGGKYPVSLLATGTPDGTKFLRDDGALATPNTPLPLYGDGSDGNVTVSTSISLTRDMYYDTLTIANGGSLKCYGYRVFCKTALIVQTGGAIHCDGGSASNNVNGASNTNNQASLGNEVAAPNGNSTTVGSAGNNINNSLGGSGGAGGTGTGGAGGIAGVASVPAATLGSQTVRALPAIITGIIVGISNNAPSNAVLRGGASGGAGGGNGTQAAGGGGAGGAILLIVAKSISNSGRISANGGNGGTTPNAGSGGGGAGGGGAVLITANSYTGTAPTANGGTGGTAGVGGSNGGNGANGSVITLVAS